MVEEFGILKEILGCNILEHFSFPGGIAIVSVNRSFLIFKIIPEV
jgi:hypothetical protein